MQHYEPGKDNDSTQDNFKITSNGSSAKLDIHRSDHAKIIKEGYKNVEKIEEISREDSIYLESQDRNDEMPAKAKDTKEFKIFIGGLSGDTTSEELHQFFSNLVQVKDAFVVVDSNTSRLSVMLRKAERLRFFVTFLSGRCRHDFIDEIHYQRQRC